MKCKKHPKYQAKRYPISECGKCLEIWNQKDVEITAAGIRKRTVRGKTRVGQVKRAAARAETKRQEAEAEASRKCGRGTKYKACREAIRKAADRGEEYLWYTFSNFRDLEGGSVYGISEALAAKLKKAGFKATVIYPSTESHEMGDSAAPCSIDITEGGVEVSWGPGKEHNKPRERYGWQL